jgi:hypothetical protein
MFQCESYIHRIENLLAEGTELSQRYQVVWAEGNALYQEHEQLKAKHQIVLQEVSKLNELSVNSTKEIQRLKHNIRTLSTRFPDTQNVGKMFKLVSTMKKGVKSWRDTTRQSKQRRMNDNRARRNAVDRSRREAQEAREASQQPADTKAKPQRERNRNPEPQNNKEVPQRGPQTTDIDYNSKFKTRWDQAFRNVPAENKINGINALRLLQNKLGRKEIVVRLRTLPTKRKLSVLHPNMYSDTFKSKYNVEEIQKTLS